MNSQSISPCLKRKVPTPDEVRPGLIPTGPSFENDDITGRVKKLCSGPRVAFKEEAKVRCHSVGDEEEVPASRSEGDEWQEFIIRTKDHDGIARDAAVVWRLLLSVFNPCQGTLVDRLLELYYTNQVQLLLDAHARVLKMIESIHRTGKTGIVCAQDDLADVCDYVGIKHGDDERANGSIGWHDVEPKHLCADGKFDEQHDVLVYGTDQVFLTRSSYSRYMKANASGRR
eukprot:753712-Hanusia_phi.AAC.8